MQLEHQRVPTIAMVILTRRQQTQTDHGNGNGNHGILTDEQLWPKQPAVLANETHNHDYPGSGMYVQTMERGEGHGVSNGLDRGRVDIVVDGVDMPARDVLVSQVLLLLLLKAMSR